MEFRIRLGWLIAAVVAAVLLCATRIVVRAHRDLVTLNVRDMDVRKLVRKIEWQTWETILVAKDVQGKVTLNVQNAPLDAVLNFIAGQVAARPSHVYPIYRNKRSLKDLKSLLRRESSEIAEAQRWTNMLGGGMGPGARFAGGSDGANAAPHSINLSFHDKDAALAAVTLAAASRARVVPEDGLDAHLNLEIHQATPKQAIRQFAKALHGNWDSFYTLQAARFDLGRNMEAGADDAERERRTQRMEARLEALSPEERARIEEMRNLSPEERQARMQARMEDPATQQRMIDRALNSIRTSTPEQIVQRKRQRQQMAQNSQQQGPGGPAMRPPFPGPQ